IQRHSYLKITQFTLRVQRQQNFLQMTFTEGPGIIEDTGPALEVQDIALQQYRPLQVGGRCRNIQVFNAGFVDVRLDILQRQLPTPLVQPVPLHLSGKAGKLQPSTQYWQGQGLQAEAATQVKTLSLFPGTEPQTRIQRAIGSPSPVINPGQQQGAGGGQRFTGGKLIQLQVSTGAEALRVARVTPAFHHQRHSIHALFHIYLQRQTVKAAFVFEADGW